MHGMTDSSPDHQQSPASAYRAYLIGQSGRIETFVHLMVENDEHAISEAKSLTHSHAVELWERARLILRLPKANIMK